MSSDGGPRRVMHFVSGGFSGATQVAIDLARAADAGTSTLLVLRRKRATDQARVQALRDAGLAVEVVPGAWRVATLWALVRLCRRWRPQVLVAHGFPEHLIGRWAGWFAARLGGGGPRLVQVEHNSRERYGPWTRWQARWLARRSAALVGVSEGVRRSLLALGAPPEKTLAIPNGIDLARFAAADEASWSARTNDIVMSARFARQKDHPTLLRALALLRERHGLAPRLTLAGAGSARYRAEAERLCAELQLGAQVDFAGHVKDMPALYRAHRIHVLATHWEGMPLALLEAMAAGCACVVSRVPGTEGLLVDGETGCNVAPDDPAALADALARLLNEPGLAERLGCAARERARAEHGIERTRERYAALLRTL